MRKTLTVSIVIPVYNEQDQLAACLESIEAQTISPFEVIVVNNNSTDDTAAVARRFDFVTLLNEPKQGVVYARDRGFNAAKGEIIGRIDADTILAPDWVEAVQQLFEDKAVSAASGRLSYRHVGLKSVFDGLDWRIRNYLNNRMVNIGEQFLYGGNMAIRSTAWQSVRALVCHDRSYHEDLDLAVHLTKLGSKAIFAPSLKVSIAPRQADASPRVFWNYVWSSPKVYRQHGLRSQRIIYPVALMILLLYPPMRLMYRGYDSKLQKFSLTRAFSSDHVTRISPLTEPTA